LGLFDSGLAGTVRGDAWVGPLPEPLEASASEGGMHPAEPGAVAEGALLALDELRREGYAVAPDTTADAREGLRAYSLALMDLETGAVVWEETFRAEAGPDRRKGFYEVQEQLVASVLDRIHRP